MESLSQRLAEFAHDLVLEQLPEAVREHVKLLVLDAAGLCLASRDEDFIQPVLEVVEELGGPPESHPLGIARSMPAPLAALVGGTLVHGLDFDDSHVGSTIHTTADEVRHKFRSNAERSLPVGRVQALEQAILGLESLADTRRILECALPVAGARQSGVAVRTAPRLDG